MQPLSTYTPSGRVNAFRLWRIAVFGVPLIAFFSWAYANVLILDPPAFFAPLATLIFTAACAVTITTLLEKTHSRSPRFNIVVAVVLVLFAYWVRWLVFFRAMSVSTATEFALSDPLSALKFLWDYGVARAAADPSEFSAFASSLIWALELLVLGGLSILLARDRALKPFSETRKAWAIDEAGGEVFLGATPPEDIRRLIENDGVSSLMTMPRADRLQATPLASTWSTLKIKGHKLEGDASAFWLTLQHVSSLRSSEGKVKSHDEDIFKYWQISPEDYARLMAYLHDAERTAPEEVTDDSAKSSMDRPTPEALQPALAALQAGNSATALALAEGYRTHPDTHVSTDAVNLCALALSELKRWSEAYDAFLQLYERLPTAQNALQLATTSVMAGQLVRGQAWFDRAETINAQAREMPAPRLRTAFLSALEQAGEFEACEPHLAWLRSCYSTVSSTDSQILWNYGLPFFPEFLRKSLPLLRSHLDDAQLHAWYGVIRPQLDADGQRAIDEHLSSI
ncbi:hypothetical protein [Denitromonas iodatirespirans]|uniref:Uncharacterized protein n=1 Tax=Denitromonas iodatirespirans TaxID=2795389 RepID=A0A944DEP7_DENI1|nr:hypothetical protein [Denitromonas iodatirespirans]MBT0961443.1 hypothetical protein [Denitromonas iodatirespirans]